MIMERKVSKWMYLTIFERIIFQYEPIPAMPNLSGITFMPPHNAA